MRSVIFGRAGAAASRGGGVPDDWNSATTPPATPAMVARCQYTRDPTTRRSAPARARAGSSAVGPRRPPRRQFLSSASSRGPAPLHRRLVRIEIDGRLGLRAVERQRPEVFRLHLRLELAVLLERMAFAAAPVGNDGAGGTLGSDGCVVIGRLRAARLRRWRSGRSSRRGTPSAPRPASVRRLRAARARCGGARRSLRAEDTVERTHGSGRAQRDRRARRARRVLAPRRRLGALDAGSAAPSRAR